MATTETNIPKSRQVSPLPTVWRPDWARSTSLDGVPDASPSIA